MKKIILFFLLTTSSAKASDGLALLALQNKNWNCDALIASLDNVDEFRFSFLFNSFGADLDCYKRLVENEKTKHVHVYLSNGTCNRLDRKCGNYEYKYGRSVNRDKREIRRAYRQIVTGLRADTTCSVAFELESERTKQKRIQILKSVSSTFSPRCEVIDNPLRSANGRIGRYPLEQHGSGVKLSAPCIWSNDGEIFDIKTAREYAMCDRYLWSPAFNCKKSLNERFVDLRSRKSCARSRDFTKIINHQKNL
jgi:hypothetical protein